METIVYSCTVCNVAKRGMDPCCLQSARYHINLQLLAILEAVSKAEKVMNFEIQEQGTPTGITLLRTLEILLSPHDGPLTGLLTTGWNIKDARAINPDLYCVCTLSEEQDGAGSTDRPALEESVDNTTMGDIGITLDETHTDDKDETIKVSYDPVISLTYKGWKGRRGVTPEILAVYQSNVDHLRELLGCHLSKPITSSDNAKEAAALALLVHLDDSNVEVTSDMKNTLHFQLKDISIDAMRARLQYLKEEAANSELAMFAEDCPFEHNFICKSNLHVGFDKWASDKRALKISMALQSTVSQTQTDDTKYPSGDLRFRDEPMTITARPSELAIAIVESVNKLGLKASFDTCVRTVWENMLPFKTNSPGRSVLKKRTSSTVTSGQSSKGRVNFTEQAPGNAAGANLRQPPRKFTRLVNWSSRISWTPVQEDLGTR